MCRHVVELGYTVKWGHGVRRGSSEAKMSRKMVICTKVEMHRLVRYRCAVVRWCVMSLYILKKNTEEEYYSQCRHKIKSTATYLCA